jgi:hypothetical protein
MEAHRPEVNEERPIAEEAEEGGSNNQVESQQVPESTFGRVPAYARGAEEVLDQTRIATTEGNYFEAGYTNFQNHQTGDSPNGQDDHGNNNEDRTEAREVIMQAAKEQRELIESYIDVQLNEERGPIHGR